MIEFTIIGTDSVWNLKSWYKYEDIIANSKLIGISGRDGISLPADIPVDAVLQIDPRYAGISASALREHYQQRGVKAYIDDLKNGKIEVTPVV